MSKLNLRIALIALMATLALSITGCGDSKEAVLEDQIQTVKDLNAILDTVKDEASAKAAKPRVQQLADKMKEIEKRQKEVGEPTGDEAAALKKEYAKALEDVQAKLMANAARIQMIPKAYEELDSAMSKL